MANSEFATAAAAATGISSTLKNVFFDLKCDFLAESFLHGLITADYKEVYAHQK